MTSIDVTYHYLGDLTPERITALRDAFSVYGVRAIRIDEADRGITIEYDATRLDERRVAAILRAGGINLAEAPDRPE